MIIRYIDHNSWKKEISKDNIEKLLELCWLKIIIKIKNFCSFDSLMIKVIFSVFWELSFLFSVFGLIIMEHVVFFLTLRFVAHIRKVFLVYYHICHSNLPHIPYRVFSNISYVFISSFWLHSHISSPYQVIS